jgi:hypothetical protein
MPSHFHMAGDLMFMRPPPAATLARQRAASTGQAYVALPEEVRGAVREEVRRDLGDDGGPIDIEVEIRFASGRR